MAKVAEGSMVLTLDASKLNAGLKDQATKSKEAAKKMSDEFKSSINEQIGSIFGGESFIAGGAKAGAIGAAVAGVAMLGKEYLEATSQAREYERKVEASLRASAVSIEKHNEKLDEMTARWSSMSDIAGSSQGIEHLKKDIKELGKGADELKAKVDDLKNFRKKFDTKWSSEEAMDLWLGMRLGDAQKLIDGSVSQLEGDLEKRNKMIRGKEKELAFLLNPDNNYAAQAALRGYITEQSNALRLMRKEATETDIAMEKMKLQFNFSDEQLAKARQLSELRKSETGKQGLNDYLKDQADALRVLRKEATDTDIELEKLKKQFDLNDGQIEQARKLAQLRKDETNKQGLNDYLKDQTDALRLMAGQATETDLVVEKLRKQFDLTDGQTAEARRITMMKQTEQASQEARKSIVSMKNEMAGAFGMESKMNEEFMLADLIKKGAGKEEIEQLQLMIQLKKTLNDQYRSLGFIERGSAAEISMQNKSKNDAARDKKAEALVERINAIGQLQADKLQKMIEWLQKIAKNTGVDTPVF